MTVTVRNFGWQAQQSPLDLSGVLRGYVALERCDADLPWDAAAVVDVDAVAAPAEFDGPAVLLLLRDKCASWGGHYPLVDVYSLSGDLDGGPVAYADWQAMPRLSNDAVPPSFTMEALGRRFVYDDEMRTRLQAHRAWLDSAGQSGERLALPDASFTSLAMPLTGKVLDRAVLPNAELYTAPLYGASLREADLHHADLGRATLTEAALAGANLRGARLAGADLRWADLGAADLRDTDLTGTCLVEANLVDARMDGARLAETDLSGARVSAETLRGVRFLGALVDRWAQAGEAITLTVCTNEGEQVLSGEALVDWVRAFC